MDIGKIIHERRKEKGYTLEYVGKLVGVSKSTVRKWETGYIENIKRENMVKLARVLDIHIGTLMGWDEKTSAKAEALSDNELTALLKELSDDEILRLKDYIEYLLSKRERQ